MMQWVLAATLVCGTSLFTACTSDTSDNPVTPIEPRQRVIAFEGIENARDMGSLVMQDGRTVRFDMLIRSAHLSQATDADVAVLKEQYHLSDVFDFRRVRTVPDGHRHLSLQPSVQKERSSWRTSTSPIKVMPVRWMRCWLCCPTRKAATRLRLSSAP